MQHLVLSPVSLAAVVADAPSDKQSLMLGVARKVAQSMSLLLASIKTSVSAPTAANKTSVQHCAKTVAESVTKVVDAASALVPSGYVDPNDPNVIAERELMTAANAIEAAARKLASLVPAERPREANEALNFEEQIFEAVKAIAAATSALVRSATFAQRELMAMGRGGPGACATAMLPWRGALAAAAWLTRKTRVLPRAWRSRIGRGGPRLLQRWPVERRPRVGGAPGGREHQGGTRSRGRWSARSLWHHVLAHRRGPCPVGAFGLRSRSSATTPTTLCRATRTSRC